MCDVNERLNNVLISGGVDLKKKPSRYALLGRSCYKLRFGTEKEKEQEREFLVKSRLITIECIKCYYFLGNYKGTYIQGLPTQKKHRCRGIKKGNCMYFKDCNS